MNVVSSQISDNLYATNLDNNSGKSDCTAIAVTIIAVMCFAIAKTWGISALQYAGTFLLVLVVLSVDETTALFLILIVTPSTYYVKIGEASICGYLCILALCKVIVIKRILLRINIILIVVMMMALCFCTALLNSEAGIIMRIVKMASFYLIFSIAIETNSYSLQPMCMKLCRGYILGTFISLTLGLLYYLVQGKSIYAYYDYRFSGLCIDPNYFSSTLMFSIAIIISFVFQEKCKHNRIAEIILLVFFSIFGFITLSRAFFITYTVIILLAGLYLLFTKKINLWGKIATVVTIFVVFYLLRTPIWVITEQFTNRLTDRTFANLGGRGDLWNWYINRLTSSISTLLFGAGSSSKYLASGIMRSVEHSAYIEMLFTYGIFGFLCSLFAYLSINRSIKLYSSESRIKLTNIFPIITVLLVNTSISSSTNENFVFGVMIACLYMHVAKESNSCYHTCPR